MLEAHVVPQEQLSQTGHYPKCPALCYQDEALSTSFAYVIAYIHMVQMEGMG